MYNSQPPRTIQSARKTKVDPMERIRNRATKLATTLITTAAAIVFFSNIAGAQNIATADLHGVVKDPTGSVIPNATVVVRDEARNVARTQKADGQGEFRVLALAPGSYTVTVEAPNFAKLVAKNVTLTIGEQAELPLTMKVAAATESVEVNASADVIETQQTAQSTTIDQQRIDNLPINGRNYINFT